MTDKELLELAAKAAGIEGHWAGGDFNTFVRTYNGYQMGWWNPLTDDGDALRLAVKLRLRVEINERSVVVYWIADESEKSVYEYPDSVQNADYEIQHINQDKATRRAIVRAAAEIGKEMK